MFEKLKQLFKNISYLCKSEKSLEKSETLMQLRVLQKKNLKLDSIMPYR